MTIARSAASAGLALALIAGSTTIAATLGPAQSAAAAAECTLSSPFAIGGDLAFTDGTPETPGSTTPWARWSQTWMGGNWAAGGGYMNAGSTQQLANRTNETSAPVPAAPRTLYNITSTYVLLGAARTPSFSMATQAHWDAGLGQFVMPTGTQFHLYDSASRAGSVFTYGAEIAPTSSYSDVQPAVPATGAFPPLPGVTWSYAPGELIVQRQIADELAAGDALTYLTGVQSGLEVAPLSNVGPLTIEMVAAQVCVPSPSIASWADASATGTGTISGTGTFVGDTVVIRDAAGSEVGRAIVDADLRWSFELISPLPLGQNPLVVTEVDAWGFDGSSGGTFPVARPAQPSLPATGSELPTGSIALVAALVAGGIGLVGVGARRGRRRPRVDRAA